MNTVSDSQRKRKLIEILDDRMEAYVRDCSQESLKSGMQSTVALMNNNMTKEMNSLEEKLDTKLVAMEARMNNKIDELETRMINKIDQKVSELETRMNTKLDQLLTAINWIAEQK